MTMQDINLKFYIKETSSTCKLKYSILANKGLVRTAAAQGLLQYRKKLGK